MDLPDPKKFSGWLDLWKKLSPWLKVILPVVVITIAGAYFYFQFYGPVPKLKEENAGLKMKLVDAESEKSSIRDQKDEYHRENIYLKTTIVEPVKEILEQRFPEMEITDAIARLAEDVKTVHSLATRDVYKPLAAQKKKELVDKLQALLGRFTSFTHTVTICCENGNVSRAKVASDLKQYLEEAAFEVESVSRTSFFTGIPPNISIKFHPDDMDFVKQFAIAINPLYINEQFNASTQEKISRGCFEIAIIGDPLFTELGVVKFQ